MNETNQAVGAAIIAAEQDLKAIITKYGGKVPAVVVIEWLATWRAAGYNHLIKELLYNYKGQMK